MCVCVCVCVCVRVFFFFFLFWLLFVVLLEVLGCCVFWGVGFVGFGRLGLLGFGLANTFEAVLAFESILGAAS